MRSSFVSLMLLISPAIVSGLGIQVGPFSIELGGGIHADRGRILGNPVCHAIKNHKQMEVVLVVDTKVNDQEFSSVTKKVLFEPYLVGVDVSGIPVLKGNILKEEILKEVSVKYAKGSEEVEKRPFFTFSTQDGEKGTINFDQIRGVRIIPDSNVEVPDNLKDLTGDLDVLCIL